MTSAASIKVALDPQSFGFPCCNMHPPFYRRLVRSLLAANEIHTVIWSPFRIVQPLCVIS
jgi:hypothetical protein